MRPIKSEKVILLLNGNPLVSYVIPECRALMKRSDPFWREHHESFVVRIIGPSFLPNMGPKSTQLRNGKAEVLIKRSLEDLSAALQQAPDFALRQP